MGNSTQAGRSVQFDVICHESEDGFPVFLPHPHNCSLYYECVDLTPWLMSCPPGLYFDSKIDSCNWPEYVKCEESTTTSASTTTSPTSTTTTSNSTTTTTTSSTSTTTTS